MKTLKIEEERREKFLNTWGLVDKNIRMFEYWLEKHDFSIIEKRMLKAFYLFKKNKKDESLELLQSSGHADPFIEGIRCYLIGLIYNQFGHYFYAIENLEKSVAKLTEAQEQEFIVNPLSLLVAVFANRREINKMAITLDQLKEYSPKKDIRKLQIIFAEMTFYMISGNSKKAELIYRKAEKQNLEGYESFKPFFLVNLFMTYAQEKKYDECFVVLEKYSKMTGCLVRANYLYMKILLNHVVHDKPLYVYAKDFKDFPELHWQLEVIKALRAGEVEVAKKFWNKLSKHNSFLYGENFKFNGEPNLFHQSLERYLKNTKPVTISKEKLNRITKNVHKLHYILSHANGPVSCEELIGLIWDEELNQANLARLRTLASEYSKKYRAELMAVSSTYQIVKKVS